MLDDPVTACPLVFPFPGDDCEQEEIPDRCSGLTAAPTSTPAALLLREALNETSREPDARQSRGAVFVKQHL